MRRLRQLLDLTPAERSLLFRAIPLVAAVRLCLWMMPFDTFRRGCASVLVRVARPQRHEGLPPRKIVWLVAVASRSVPKAHCLTRSVAAQMLLARQGYFAIMQIGVRKDGDELDAHAWLEHEGLPLSESELHLSRFTRLTSISPWPEALPTAQ